MEAFYLKINRPTFITCRYLAQWIEAIKQIPDARAYVICDNPDLTQLVERSINFGELYHEFMPSRRDSKELRHIVQSSIADNWKLAAYAHFTPFLHAREMGYENFWSIDGDDLGLYAEPQKIAELLMTIKNYAEEHEIDAFSLDMWRTWSSGRHWSFGVVYTRNSINWLEIMKTHCQDAALKYLYERVLSRINADWLFTYLRRIEAVRLESFYVENLRIIHHHDDVYRFPICGIRYCADGKCHFSIFANDFDMGEGGAIKIYPDVIKLNFDLTAAESMAYLKKVCSFYTALNLKRFEFENHPENIPVTIILPISQKDESSAPPIFGVPLAV